MKTKSRNITTLDEFKNKHFGKRGTKKREKLETGMNILNQAYYSSKHVLKKD
jgi:hypothetical protein